ncbi:MAG: periplasmic heavy metal sensor [Gemmatimonadetes bacterium]|nr:periplasmic heavy metal sensor [Gemmatimonadota bacterium]
MNRTSYALLIVIALGLSGSPLIGQEVDTPAGVEQLERVRLERLQKALELNDREARELETVMLEFRRQNRQAAAERRRATQRLQQALQEEPVNDDEVRRALDQVEAQRHTTERLREQQRQRLGQLLTPQQRAKFMLFNRQFDARLRQLMAQRRSDRRQEQRGDQRGVRQPRGSNALQNQPDRRPDQQRPRD